MSYDSVLLTEGDALYVEGVGLIGQYHSWLDTLWQKGLPYFIRDVKFKELESLLAYTECERMSLSARKKRISILTSEVQQLNSKIRAWECQSRQ